MKELSGFQTGLLIAFAVFALAGVWIFATSSSSKKGAGQVELLLWGTFPADSMDNIVNVYNGRYEGVYRLKYESKDRGTMDRDLVEALARGRGPDMIILPDELFYRHSDKLAPFPAEMISQRDYRDKFATVGDIFTAGGLTYALPLTIDPLVTYWNRAILDATGIARVPATWEEVLANAPLITKRDERGNIITSAVSLGGTKNMANSKAILSVMLLQVGDSITSVGSDGSVFGTLGQTEPAGSPSVLALSYYTQFADPVKRVYSWNTALPEARSLFTDGRLALYFGFASEMYGLRDENPNIDLDVAPIPHQLNGTRITFGKVHGVAVLRSSPRALQAYGAAYALTDPAYTVMLTSATGMPSATRVVLATTPSDPSFATFYREALVSRAWVDPDPNISRGIFERLIERTLSGILAPDRAIAEAGQELARALGSR